ncbi:hypothetical protein Kpho01_17090 [Kitasatospora phosalacinea]|uniref:Uncharacterized protein n=1 Tax=Kitasatospora phosalacinea TaxID=2065 RepID=A0A9W6UMY1_9ACTN|nr:hypothetical protein Kpho01_17090 [Kitasatospora phosalacinea]
MAAERADQGDAGEAARVALQAERDGAAVDAERVRRGGGDQRAEGGGQADFPARRPQPGEDERPGEQLRLQADLADAAQRGRER